MHRDGIETDAGAGARFSLLGSPSKHHFVEEVIVGERRQRPSAQCGLRVGPVDLSEPHVS
jgi:hypothetical protein